MSGTGRHVIATIGIDRYRHWRPLHNAVGDALGAGALFRQLGFEEVAPPLLDAHATRDAIEALATDELTSLKPGDSLIVFYAGHGGARTLRVGGRDVRTGYLIPVDGGDSGRVNSWIELDPWLRRISRLPPRHILVILDACFSGIALSSAVKWGRDSGTLLGLPFAAANARPSRLVITSALDDEQAMDSGPTPGHSLFTGCLIEALTGGVQPVGARDGRAVIIGSELGRYVRHRVQTYPGRPGWQQTPDLGTFDFDERGEMLIPVLIGDDLAAAPTGLARGSLERFPERPQTRPQEVEPAASGQVTIEPLSTEPSTVELMTIQPASTGPSTAQPASTELRTATAQPASTEPASIRPSATDSPTALLEVMAIESAAIDVMAIEAVAIEAVALEAMAIESMAAEAAADEAVDEEAAELEGAVNLESAGGTAPMATQPAVTAADVEAQGPWPEATPRATRFSRRFYTWLIGVAVAGLVGAIVGTIGYEMQDAGTLPPTEGPPLTSTTGADLAATGAPELRAARFVGSATNADAAAREPKPEAATPAVAVALSMGAAAGAPEIPTTPSSDSMTRLAPAAGGQKQAAVPSSRVDNRANALMAAAAPRICPTWINSPKGAEVSWNSVVATLPVQLSLPCDTEVALTFRKSHYVTATRKITATADRKPINVRLQKATVSVAVTSTPPGATISVGKRDLGSTPVAVKLPEFETSTVTFARDGYQSITRKITPAEDGGTLHVTLTPVPSSR